MYRKNLFRFICLGVGIPALFLVVNRLYSDGSSPAVWLPIITSDAKSDAPLPQVTPPPSPTMTPTPTALPPSPGAAPTDGIFISPSEIAQLPRSGEAWQNILEWAQRDTQHPQLSDNNDDTDAAVFAKALVFVRTGEQSYRTEVIAAIIAAMGTEDGGKTLPLARNLTAYVIAAELVRLDLDTDATFRAWLNQVRYKTLEGRTLISTHEDMANNWGTHAGAARIAVARYLSDEADLQRAAIIFKGWTGDRSAYDNFNFGDDLSWQCDSQHPVAVNPTNCIVNGLPVDGVLPDDQRRGGSFTVPPPQENYVWEALQGAYAQAYMLQRAGYPAYGWQNHALLRAVNWLHGVANYPATGDDTGTVWLVNSIYGTRFPTVSPARPGKNGLGFYDWFTAGG